ncbi:MAG: D-2-hydroxyacid dehydrogenase [Dehalococcoidia bacterium]
MRVMVNLQLEQDPVVADRLTDGQLARVRAVSEEVEIVVAETPEQQATELPHTEVIFGEFNRGMFELARSLRWVQALAAGVDHILFDELVKSDIVLTSAKGAVGGHLADHAWALLLGVARGIGRAVREHSWDSRYSIRRQSLEMENTTMGIIGLGGTGVEVARRAQGFGMGVIAVDPEEVSKPTFVEEVWTIDRFYDLLEGSDVVVICAPLTKETQGMFDEEAFRHMRRHALLINVTRGDIVDGPSLIKALEEGTIGGAGLDVTPEEPLPPDSPLWSMSNVIITPHTAGGSPHRLDRTVDLFCENLRRYLAGKPLLGVIDKEKGY